MVQQDRIFKTTYGKIYEVTGLTLQLVLELQPAVVVLRNGEDYKLIVEGFDEPLIFVCLNCSKSSTHSVSAAFREEAATVKAVQSALNFLGFDPNSADGILGSKTRSAVKKFSLSSNRAVADIEVLSEPHGDGGAERHTRYAV